ncbi:SH3 domain-containing protein [Rudaea sp.]|uniref:SH3 domain-containing protein n=1 Tax=Rudaea sp. TaxID=2136325 RepID=UPI002ED34011
MAATIGEANRLGCTFSKLAPWNNPRSYWSTRCVTHSGDGVADAEETRLKQRLEACKAGDKSGGMEGTAAVGQPPMQQTEGSCRRGTATVAINQPGLDKLNVRAAPGGQVTGTVPEGETVSVTGPCGASGGAAGIVAKRQSSGDDWCQLSAPVSGCVSAQFLKFGGGNVGQPGGAAGFAKSKEHQASAPVTASFDGSWSADADNVAYSISLSQEGTRVSGRYQGADGSAGQINGQVSGKVLRFTWMQKDGTRGSGKFVLSADGESFDGTYSSGNGPDAIGGSWNGTRQ